MLFFWPARPNPKQPHCNLNCMKHPAFFLVQGFEHQNEDTGDWKLRHSDMQVQVYRWNESSIDECGQTFNWTQNGFDFHWNMSLDFWMQRATTS